MGLQTAVGLTAGLTLGLLGTGGFAACMITGSLNDLAFCDFRIAAQTPGVAAVACLAAGFLNCITDLRAACMVFCIHCTVRLFTGFTYSLCCAGCGAAAMGYLFIGCITGCALMPVAFCIILPCGIEVMSLQAAVGLTAGLTLGFLGAGGFAACMISGSFNDLALCNLRITTQTPGIAAVACLAAGFLNCFTDLRAACVVCCIYTAIYCATGLTLSLCRTGCVATAVSYLFIGRITGCALMPVTLSVMLPFSIEVMVFQFSVSLATVDTLSQFGTGGFAAGMRTGRCDLTALTQFCSTTQTPGIAGITSCTTGNCDCIPNLRATYMVFCILFTVGLLTGLTYCLCCAGCGTTAVGYLFIGRITDCALMPVVFAVILPCCIEVMVLHSTVALTTVGTLSQLGTGSFTANMGTGCRNHFTRCTDCITALTPGITGVARLTTGCRHEATQFCTAGMFAGIQFAIAITTHTADFLCNTVCNTALMVALSRNCITV